MLTLPLEPTDDRANPVFKDAASCAKWLAQLQLTNLQLPHSLLLTEINELNRFPMRGLERFNTLELLRDTAHYVQDEYAKKLSAKPLPLNEQDLIVFMSIVQLWQAMALGYQRCLQTHLAGDKSLEKHVAVLCQRALLYSGLAIFEHFRTGYETDEKLWRQLHGLYAFAEDQELLAEKVPDPLSRTPSSSCHDTYIKTLLTSYARPSELGRAQLQLLDNWLSQWSSLLTVQRNYSTSKGDAPPLAFDLGDFHHGLQPVNLAKRNEDTRYLATVPLSKLIRVKTILLQQGRTPQQVELGDSGNALECVELLTFLHQCWCEHGDLRFVARNQSSQSAQLCCDLNNIYTQLTGKSHKQPAKPSANDRTAQKQIETFGRILQDSPNRQPVEMVSQSEIWRADNENIQGAQLTRETPSGRQLSRSQLVALRLGNAENFTLGVTTWIKVLRTGQLRIGVRYLPGKVEAVNLLAIGADQPASGKSTPAFLLQAAPSLKTPPSLVMARDWFNADRVVELLPQDGVKQNVKMGFCVERGIDYARISFTPA